MALEVARQLALSNDPNAMSIILNDTEFRYLLAMSAFIGTKSSVEFHLVARLDDEDSAVYQFDIFLLTSAVPPSCTLHFSGKLGWTSEPIEIPELHKRETMSPQTLTTWAQVFTGGLESCLNNVILTNLGFTGSFTPSAKTWRTKSLIHLHWKRC